MEPTDVHVYFQMTVEVIAVISALAGVIAWLNRQITKKIAQVATDLDDKTQNIRSGYHNGGGSLADVAVALKDLRRDNDTIHDLLGAKVDFLNSRITDHLNYHDRRRLDAGPPPGHTERRKESP